MTFMDMARSVFAGAPTAQLECVARIMEEAYCAALRACSWRSGGIDYLFDRPHARRLTEIINIVHEKGGPL